MGRRLLPASFMIMLMGAAAGPAAEPAPELVERLLVPGRAATPEEIAAAPVLVPRERLAELLALPGSGSGPAREAAPPALSPVRVRVLAPEPGSPEGILAAEVRRTIRVEASPPFAVAVAGAEAIVESLAFGPPGGPLVPGPVRTMEGGSVGWIPAATGTFEVVLRLALAADRDGGWRVPAMPGPGGSVAFEHAAAVAVGGQVLAGAARSVALPAEGLAFRPAGERVSPAPVPASPQARPPAKPVAAWVGSSRVDLQACKLEYSIVSPK